VASAAGRPAVVCRAVRVSSHAAQRCPRCAATDEGQTCGSSRIRENEPPIGAAPSSPGDRGATRELNRGADCMPAPRVGLVRHSFRERPGDVKKRQERLEHRIRSQKPDSAIAAGSEIGRGSSGGGCILLERSAPTKAASTLPRVRARPLGGKVPGWFGRRRTG
jgi:hypothetical protein